MLRRIRNLAVDIMAAFILDREARHAFRDKYKKKSDYRKLKDLYNQLVNENDVLKSQQKSQSYEIKHLLDKNRELSFGKNFLELSILRNTKNPVYHFSLLSFGNAGDNMLVYALQKSIKQCMPGINFIDRYGRIPLNDLDIHLINQSKAFVFGGHGAMLKDTFKNERTGWQFPVTAEQLGQIEVPIFILAVGYNRFRGQEDFSPVFRENINAVVRKASFVGLRNNGSVRAVREYLDEDIRDRVSVHPCATTIISRIYDMPPAKPKEDGFIAISGAFDRSGMRFGNRKEEILEAIAKVALKLSERYRIKYYVHMQQELEMLSYFDAQGLEYEAVKLYGTYLTEQRFLEIYSAPAMVMGMRGHSLMIPFGCNTPILSITCHEKQTWFLEDTGHPEWGVDVTDRDFEDRLLGTANQILDNQDEVKRQIAQAQDRFYDITVRNLGFIASCMDI